MRYQFADAIKDARTRIAAYARGLRRDGFNNYVVRGGIRTFIASIVTAFSGKGWQ